MPEFQTWVRACQDRFESFASSRLPAADRTPRRLHEAMRYAVLGGGKRIRPLLAYASGSVMDASGSGMGSSGMVGDAGPALDCVALALEYVHVYSLVHDDLPCMDDDVLRRGKPTVHVAFDEATAMLVGDALQAEAFRVLAEAPIAPAARADLIRDLALAAGTDGMCGGQAIDLDAMRGQADFPLDGPGLEKMHGMKTGALVRAAIVMGARAGGADEAVLSLLDRYAAAIGLAFQIVDDILDVEASSEELGKTAGKDAAQNKPTYVTVLGLDAARRRAADLRESANHALACLETEAGLPADRALRLRQLADLIVSRRR